MNTYNSHPRAMVLLVGEQPAPNLLPVRQTKPDVAALVHTDYTKHTAENLRRLLEPMCRCLLCEVDAYEIPLIRETMDRFLEEEIKEHSLLFNLTGGTKPMVLAAFDLAHRHGAPFVYMETKEGETILYTYSISEEGTIRLDRKEVLKESITIDDYLRAYLGEYEVTGFSSGKGGAFERAVYEALKPYVDEVVAGVRKGGALEIDLVLRCGNQIGIAEVKTGKAGRKKRPLEQLITASTRKFLGIHVRRFLILSIGWDRGQGNLRELAEARGISVIELPHFGEADRLSEEDRQRLVGKVLERLGKK